MQERPFDLVLFGASGFTGRLVAEYLLKREGPALRWALAGRNLGKLSELKRELQAPAELPLLQADAGDRAALAALVAQARVVITTVGPYQLHGEALAHACAEAGTDYVDLCGEPLWMARMIPLLQPLAERSGARIVFSCGFDSIPFDLGVVYLQAAAQARFGAPCREVHGLVRVIKGTASGGTLASGMETFKAMSRDPALARLQADPFALTPGFRGPAQPDNASATFDDWAQGWTAPFVMATINTKNVHRSNALRGHPWGQEFVYIERQWTGEGAAGKQRARRLARQSRWQNALLGFAPTRALLRRFVLAKPGEGPTAQQRERGRYELLFIGKTAQGQVLRAVLKGDRDPGYGSTCKLIGEAALVLLEIDRQQTPGGVWTAGAAMGLALQRRLQERAGLSFEIEAG